MNVVSKEAIIVHSVYCSNLFIITMKPWSLKCSPFYIFVLSKYAGRL